LTTTNVVEPEEPVSVFSNSATANSMLLKNILVDCPVFRGEAWNRGKAGEQTSLKLKLS
jgi:hypothetical protein